jgi:hypothetical protein
MTAAEISVKYCRVMVYLQNTEKIGVMKIEIGACGKPKIAQG